MPARGRGEPGRTCLFTSWNREVRLPFPSPGPYPQGAENQDGENAADLNQAHGHERVGPRLRIVGKTKQTQGPRHGGTNLAGRGVLQAETQITRREAHAIEIAGE